MVAEGHCNAVEEMYEGECTKEQYEAACTLLKEAYEKKCNEMMEAYGTDESAETTEPQTNDVQTNVKA